MWIMLGAIVLLLLFIWNALGTTNALLGELRDRFRNTDIMLNTTMGEMGERLRLIEEHTEPPRRYRDPDIE